MEVANESSILAEQSGNSSENIFEIICRLFLAGAVEGCALVPKGEISAGGPVRLFAEEGANPKFSPDGESLAFEIRRSRPSACSRIRSVIRQASRGR